ncbi:MAG: hypothetical protein JO013_03695 [Alphaproteobacteria bacterium]|nr:hypothetical protein [Alphaproteobacteria bacterium]
MRNLRTVLAAAVAALATAVAAPAEAGTCSAANTYNFAFNSVAAQTLNYANSYTYTATTSGGASQNFTVSFATNGLSSSTVNPGSGNVQMPAIGGLITGVGTGNTLNVGGTFSSRTDTAFTLRTIKIVFTFATPIRDMTLKVHDIDYSSNQYRDWLMVQGANGASTYTPTLSAGGTTPTLVIGPNATYPSLTAGQALGTATNGNTNSNGGDVNVSFTQPVTSVTVSYGNYPYTTGENTTGQQAIGISTIAFCPMPNVTTTKTSAPLATTGTNRFGVPGSDIIYTITVTNSGASPVDAASIVLTDPLPSQATFYNGAFSPGTDPFLLTPNSSGVTLAAANVSYSSNGTTYGYTPTSGYDANVKAVKFQPQGTMAANSSFSIQYRVQIK